MCYPFQSFTQSFASQAPQKSHGEEDRMTQLMEARNFGGQITAIAVDIAISAQKGITTCAGAVARNLLGIEGLSSNYSVSLQCSCEPPVGHFSADAVLWLFCQVSKITSATVVSSQVLSLICTSAFQHLGRAHFASQISARPRQHRGIRRDVIFAIHYWHMFTLDHVYGIHTIGCIPIVPC